MCLNLGEREGRRGGIKEESNVSRVRKRRIGNSWGDSAGLPSKREVHTVFHELSHNMKNILMLFYLHFIFIFVEKEGRNRNFTFIYLNFSEIS